MNHIQPMTKVTTDVYEYECVWHENTHGLYSLLITINISSRLGDEIIGTHYVRPSVRPSQHLELFCMKIVARLIIGVRVIVGLLDWVHYMQKITHNMQCRSIRPYVCLMDYHITWYKCCDRWDNVHWIWPVSIHKSQGYTRHLKDIVNVANTSTLLNLDDFLYFCSIHLSEKHVHLIAFLPNLICRRELKDKWRQPRWF